MKKNLLLWTLRILIGGLFLYSGFIKILDPHLFAQRVANYHLLGERGVSITAVLLPWLEIWTGLSLIILPPLRPAAWCLITCMLLLFTAVKLSALARGLDIPCGCGTRDAPMTVRDVFQNILLLALTLPGLRMDGFPPPSSPRPLSGNPCS